MKRKSKKRIISVFAFGFLLSVLLIAAALCVCGFLVKNNDMRGGELTVLLFVSMLPGCFIYPLFVQRKLRLKGLFCGLICGVIISVSYLLFVLTILDFNYMPLVWMLLPAGIAAAVCSGIFTANFFRS